MGMRAGCPQEMGRPDQRRLSLLLEKIGGIEELAGAKHSVKNLHIEPPY